MRKGRGREGQGGEMEGRPCKHEYPASCSKVRGGEWRVSERER